MTQSAGSNWRIHVPLIELPARFNRRTKKLVNQSPWLTMNDRDSWHRRKKLTLHYRAEGARLAAEHQLPFMQRAHMTYWVSYGSNRRLDPSNYMLTVKAVVDGMTETGWLVDDDSKHLLGPDPRRDESLPRGLTLDIREVL